MEFSNTHYMQNILNIVNHISSRHLNYITKDKNNFNKPRNLDLLTGDDMKLFHSILKRSLLIYSNCSEAYLTAAIEDIHSICYDVLDCNICSTLLPMDIINFTDFPILAEVIAIILRSLSASNRSLDAESADLLWKCTNYLEKSVANLESNVKKCLYDTCNNSNMQLRIILQTIFKLLMKHDWRKDNTIIKLCLENILSLLMDSLLQSRNVMCVPIIINYGIDPLLKYKVVKEECDVMSYLNKLWTTSKTLFEMVQLMKRIDKEKLSIAYLIFSYLISIDEHKVSTKFCSHVTNDDQFWNMLKFGATQADALIRKRSLAVFKWIFEIYQSNRDLANLPDPNPIGLSLKDASLFKTWTDYFIIMESLEEPQVHLLKPIFTKLSRLYGDATCNVVNGFIPIDWILLLFQRAFSHCNKNVQHYSLVLFLKQDYFNEKSASIISQFVISHLLTVLSHAYLFGKCDTENNICVGTLLTCFMRLLYNCSDINTKEMFINGLLNSIFDGRSWGSIPLFYVVRSIPLSDYTTFWTFDQLKVALMYYKYNLSTHDQVIRSAVQCQLIILILRHAGKNLSLMQFSSLIRHLNKDESWKKNSYCWKLIIDFYSEKENITKDLKEIKAFVCCNSCQDTTDIAVAYSLAVAVYQRNGESNCDIGKDVLCPHLSYLTYLKDCEQRPYLDISKITWVLKLSSEVIEILSNFPHCKDNFGNNAEVTTICQSLICLLLTLDHSDDNCINACFYIIKFFNILKLFSKLYVEKVLNDFSSQLLQYLNDSYDGDSYINMKNIFIHEFILTNFYEKLAHHQKQMFLVKVMEYFTKTSVSRVQEEHHEKSLKALCNSLLYISLKEPNVIDLRLISNLPLMISTAGKDIVSIIFQITKNLVSQILQTNQMKEILNALIKTSQDHRKGCCLYRSLISSISSIIFHPKMLSNEIYQATVLELSHNLIALNEEVLGISYILTQSLIDSINHVPNIRSLLDIAFIKNIFLPLALSGTAYQKQHKVTKDTILFIEKYHAECVVHPKESEYESDKKARVLAIRFILSLNENNPVDRIFVVNTAAAIQQCFQQALYQNCVQGSNSESAEEILPKLKRKLRDFPNSYRHRLKTRLLQMFLVTIPFLTEDDCKGHLHWLCSILSEEQQQASTRYLIEWSVTILCLRNNGLISYFIREFDEGINNRLGSTASFLASLTLIACSADDLRILEEVLQKVLPWTMSNHYNIRLYAQLALKNLWRKVTNDARFDLIRAKYSPLYECLFAIENKLEDEYKNLFALQSEFLFAVFSPLDHFTIQTIFYEIPRLSQVSCDEWISVEYIKNFQIDLPMRTSLQLLNSDSKLSEAEPPQWIKKAEETPQDENCQFLEADIKNVQQKMTPWRSMLADIQPGTRPCFDSNNTEVNNASQRKSNLIVVASLVDKLPNLGGLCRTCEIFGVENYCISSLNIIRELQFTSLSLTAHQWVPLQEVKPRDVKDYILRMRDDGYLLVGLEQTAHSITIDKFKFQKKTILLLGNEREGMPCDLIQLMDACIEIPQTGILRSLNVHVSGAIAIWEYTRQNTINKEVEECPSA